MHSLIAHPARVILEFRPITDINYSTNQIEVDKNLTWANGQGVALAYSGARPDIGAYEYPGANNQAPAAPGGLSVR